jgi:hypothetical protein
MVVVSCGTPAGAGFGVKGGHFFQKVAKTRQKLVNQSRPQSGAVSRDSGCREFEHIFDERVADRSENNFFQI